jgi:hypothetical protein
MFSLFPAAVLLVLAPTTFAHLALIHPSMYGWTDDPNQADFVTPLADMPFGDGTNGWWFHGYKNKPPAAGVFMELVSLELCGNARGCAAADWIHMDQPAGGKFEGQIACNKYVPHPSR